MIREGGSHGGGAGEGELGVFERQPGRGLLRPAEGRRVSAARRILVLVLEEEPVPRREDGGWTQEIKESRCVASAGYSSYPIDFNVIFFYFGIVSFYRMKLLMLPIRER